MRGLRHIFTLGILMICSVGFGQINNDSICLSVITDTIKSKNQADKFIIKLNDRLIENGQEYCFSAKVIKSLDIYKSMSIENPYKIESITIDLKINQVLDKLTPKFYLYVDSMPEFYGGMTKMLSFIGENFKYPSEIDACCKVYIQFIVTESGKLIDIKIIRGLQELFDKELIRVFSIMPDWQPGVLNGKHVPVRMTFPIDFTLR